MAKSRFRTKGKWIACAGGATLLLGGWWLTRELQILEHKLRQAHPVATMTGEREGSVYLYLPKSTEGLGSSLQWEDLATAHPPGTLTAWQPDLSRTPWELVKMARSDDRERRQLGLKLLASLTNLHVGLCQQIAQASDQRMALGLATTRRADLNMLLPPPPPPSCLAETTVERDMKMLLSSLPRVNLPKCVEYLTVLGLTERPPKPVQLDAIADPWWFEGRNSMRAPQLNPPPSKPFGTVMLQALLAHSTVAENRESIVRHMGLPILLKYYRKMTKVTEHTRIMAQIVGNLALDKNCHQQIFQSGWISVLAEWSRNSNLEIALTAARALSNLNAVHSNDSSVLEDGLYIAHPLHWETNIKVSADVVFVHGLLGGAFKTWRQHDRKDNSVSPTNSTSSYTRCWPKDWLARDFSHLRILLVDYDTQLTEWGRLCPYDSERRSLEERSREFLDKLHKAGIGKRPIVWVTHSMGGLLVKRMLVLSAASHDPEIRRIHENTKGVVFYSVPHRGTQMATFHFGSQYLLSPSPEVRQLEPDSPALDSLHADFMELVRSKGTLCLSFCETSKTVLGNLHFKATFVSKESSALDYGESHDIPSDHVYICKPANPESPIYHHLIAFMQRLVPA